MGWAACPNWRSSSIFDGWGPESVHGGIMGELKLVLKNTCQGANLLVKLPAISSKFTKNELLYTYFSRILARFLVIIYCVLEFQEHLYLKAPFNVGFCWYL